MAAYHIFTVYRQHYSTRACYSLVHKPPESAYSIVWYNILRSVDAQTTATRQTNIEKAKQS